MTDILETVKALKELKEETAAVEDTLKDLLTAIQDVLGGPGVGGEEATEADEPTDPDKPAAFASVDYYDLPGKGIPEPLGPAPPATRTETPRETEEEDE